ncbi:MAG: polysaccharide deacetylase [Lactobacillales bacterium]|nr:polysaccharide deacetylase [Lactobacillales bacterium]
MKEGIILRKHSRHLKRKRKKKFNIYFICIFVFFISVIGVGFYFYCMDGKDHCSEKIKRAKEHLNKKSEIQEKKTPLPKYNEKLDVSNDGRLVGAMPESANQHGYSSLKVWEILQSNYFPPLEDKKTIFLTFDDGPSGNTEEILAVLSKYKIKATFFVTGSAVQHNPVKLKKIYEEGHALGNHTFSHVFSILYPGGVLNFLNFNNEIEQTEKQIQFVLGESFYTRSIRCPGGSMSWQGMDSLFEDFKNKGLASIDWNAVNGDAEGGLKTASELVNKCKETAKYGINVILMHDKDEKSETVKALPEIIEYYLHQGYQFKILI